MRSLYLHSVLILRALHLFDQDQTSPRSQGNLNDFGHKAAPRFCLFCEHRMKLRGRMRCTRSWAAVAGGVSSAIEMATTASSLIGRGRPIGGGRRNRRYQPALLVGLEVGFEPKAVEYWNRAEDCQQPIGVAGVLKGSAQIDRITSNLDAVDVRQITDVAADLRSQIGLDVFGPAFL